MVNDRPSAAHPLLAVDDARTELDPHRDEQEDDDGKEGDQQHRSGDEVEHRLDHSVVGPREVGRVDDLAHPKVVDLDQAGNTASLGSGAR